MLSHSVRSRSSMVAVQRSGCSIWHLLIYPLFAGISLADGEGLEPSLTDQSYPRLVLVRTSASGNGAVRESTTLKTHTVQLSDRRDLEGFTACATVVMQRGAASSLERRRD